jgi:pimeloyl-ACP methyl ester carboxylesterase
MTDLLPTSAQAHLIDLPGGRFRYLTWGVEETRRPDMLLLHGITSSALSWVRAGPALADRYRVYALDMRGHGESIQSPPGTYSLRQTADDAADLIAALGLENPVVIGHSWGGATAMALASGAWSERPAPALAQVMLEDPAYAFGQGDVEARTAFYTRDIGRPAEELRPEIAASSPGWTEADIEGKIEALQQVTRTAVLSVFKEAGEAGDILPLLARIAAPTLLMRADANLGTTMDDAAWARAQGYLTGHSRGVEIPGATHNIHRSRFDTFMEAVNGFLTE